MGEGCVELRDINTLKLVGWYLGRYENGVRHGIGQDILILENMQDASIKYKIIDRNYNKGRLVVDSFLDTVAIVVDDIMQNIKFFGFMGLVKSCETKLHDELCPFTDLEISDFQFFENNESLVGEEHLRQDLTLRSIYENITW